MISYPIPIQSGITIRNLPANLMPKNSLQPLNLNLFHLHNITRIIAPEKHWHKAGGASLMGCCWPSRLRKIRLFFGERGGEMLNCFRIVQCLRRIRLFFGETLSSAYI